MKEKVDSIERFCDGIETANKFCCSGDRLNASRVFEVAVTARVRIGWVRFRKWIEVLLRNRFPLKVKGKTYHCCVRSAISENQTWCLKEKEKVI